MALISSCNLPFKFGGSILMTTWKSNTFGTTFVKCISSKAMRHRLQAEPKPAPFPYQEKRYNFFRALFDSTPNRLDENSKLILVEGPPTAGKGVLAKELAEELDMAYFPAPTQAEKYINSYGFDLKTLDHELPEPCRSYDENSFLKDPFKLSGTKAGRFQLWKFQLRYRRYLDALAHILNTGQGVVMDRSPYSDFTYIEAMAQHGIVSNNILRFYHEVRNNSLFALWRPHLVIYLDVPVKEVRLRIENRNRPFEKSSPATSPAYLQSIENAYKQKFLKEVSDHAEVLIYDWTEVGDTEILVEDIERLDFDQYTIYDTKMEDWRRVDKWDWNVHRQKFTHGQDLIMHHTNIPGISCPEILFDPNDIHVYDRVIDNHVKSVQLRKKNICPLNCPRNHEPRN
uniref:NADH dehydrogenase [ubiquinone] 1 alpha subcomplex subunit 10, mitochondrial n=1 Tax=Alona affinis TaxID=381656 RepID=A0A9N6WNW8_9CRUS|nr:EOG090X05NZ [Alona affinis]